MELGSSIEILSWEGGGVCLLLWWLFCFVVVVVVVVVFGGEGVGEGEVDKLGGPVWGFPCAPP